MIPPDEANKDEAELAQQPIDPPTGGQLDAAESDSEVAPDEPEPTPEQQLAEVNDKWLRARADLDNARRRARLDLDDARSYGASALISELLNVLDTLQRALATPGDTDPQLLEGLQMTERMFLTALENHGVVPVEAAHGDDFDPALHRAVVEQPSEETHPGSILAELVRGYQLKDRLLREAQVVVAKRPDPAPDPVSDPPPIGDGDADV